MDYAAYVQEQVSRKDWRTLQKIDVNLDLRILAEIWPDFVNIKKRMASEIPFLLSQLEEFRHPLKDDVVPTVFDACMGSGATTIGLRQEGIPVFSNELDEDLVAKALIEAEKRGMPLLSSSYDWRNLDIELKLKVDAVLCLGNSLTYLFKEEDQLRALENFRGLLGKHGKLIIDERNYAEHFLKGLDNYRFSGNYVYCGKNKVSVHPIHISDTMVVMEYEHKKSGEKAHLVLHPFKKNEMVGLLLEAGFRNIKSFGDYQPKFDIRKPEFITYVCKK